MKHALPTDPEDRKNYPLMRGCLLYFPAALAGVARISKMGNDRHNPGEEMHHARGKSTDHGDCIIRHLHDAEEMKAAFVRGPEVVDTQKLLDEANQLCWRALAYSQELHERFGNAPLAAGAKLPADHKELSKNLLIEKPMLPPGMVVGRLPIPGVAYGLVKANPAEVDADGGAVTKKFCGECHSDLSCYPHAKSCTKRGV